MNRSNLTDLKCKRLPKGRHADGGGLYLEVKDGGTRSWSLIYQMDGRRRQMGLGPYPEVSLADARKRATEQRVLIKREKIDPLENEREKKGGRKTFSEYAEEYISRRENQWRNRKSEVQWSGTIRDTQTQ